MPLHCIIVDDDEISRKVLEKCIEQTEFLELVGKYSNAIDARSAINNKAVDLIFLDIEMPEMTGLEFIQRFPEVPQIIFVTSQKQYALEAFEYDVTDYVTKPVSYERFLKAAEKAKRIHEIFESEQSSGMDFFVKSDSKMVKINLGNLLYVEALGDYVRLITEEKKYTVLSTMKAFDAKLPSDLFMRVHKSYIINLSKIDKVEKNIAFVGTHEIPVSRTYKESLRDHMRTLQLKPNIGFK